MVAFTGLRPEAGCRAGLGRAGPGAISLAPGASPPGNSAVHLLSEQGSWSIQRRGVQLIPSGCRAQNKLTSLFGNHILPPRGLGEDWSDVRSLSPGAGSIFNDGFADVSVAHTPVCRRSGNSDFRRF